MQRIKRVARFVFYTSLVGLVTLSICDVCVEEIARKHIYENIENVPSKNAALVLGTSLRLSNGRVNPYFLYRIQAAVELYKNGKVNYLIVSGDNGRESYDESTDMKNMLMELGVPESAIYLDFAGFRTLDSVVRCEAIFGQTEVIVVSQKFHNERAVFLAKAKGINAIGYNAKDLNTSLGLRVHLREKLARVKAVMDIILRTKPKYLGPKIELKNA